MEREYTVGDNVITLTAVADLVGIRFKEPAKYSSRSKALSGPEFGAFNERFEVPNEKFTVVKVAAAPTSPNERLDAAVESLQNDAAVERVSPVFAVGGAYAMATDRLLVGFTSASGAKPFLTEFEEILSKEGNEYVCADCSRR